MPISCGIQEWGMTVSALQIHINMILCHKQLHNFWMPSSGSMRDWCLAPLSFKSAPWLTCNSWLIIFCKLKNDRRCISPKSFWGNTKPSNPCFKLANSMVVAYATFSLCNGNSFTISRVVSSLLCTWWPQWTAAYKTNGYWFKSDCCALCPCLKASNKRYWRQVNAMSTWASGNNDCHLFKKYSCVV